MEHGIPRGPDPIPPLSAEARRYLRRALWRPPRETEAVTAAMLFKVYVDMLLISILCIVVVAVVETWC